MAITDEYSAREWLERQSDQRIHIAFAARSALRSAPGLVFEPHGTRGELVLHAFRAVLVAGVATTRQSHALWPEVEAAARHADFAVLSVEAAARYAASAAYSAARCASSYDSSESASAYSADAAARYAAASSRSAASRDVYSASSSLPTNFTAKTAAFSACAWDAAYLEPKTSTPSSLKGVFARPIWPTTKIGETPPNEPMELYRDYIELTNFFDHDPQVWGFWKRWLEGMRNGQPIDWALQKQVALIPDEVWKVGPEAVAAAISKIEAELEDEIEPLDQDRLQSHAEGLLRQPDLAADAAESMALQVEGHIADFKREAPANNLPDGFEKLESLPIVFRGISTTIRISGGTDDNTAKLVAEINRLHAVIAGLERDLAKAHHALSDARLSKLEAAQQRTLGEKTQTWLTNITLIGSLGLNMAWFMGLEREDLRYPALKAQIEQRIEQMKAAEPSEDDADLPPTREL